MEKGERGGEASEGVKVEKTLQFCVLWGEKWKNQPYFCAFYRISVEIKLIIEYDRGKSQAS